MNEPNFWDDIDKANKLNQELTNIKKEITSYKKTEKEILDSKEILELIKLEPSDEIQQELENSLVNIEKTLDELEISTLLSGEHDSSDGYLEIHPGAGGT